jgi:hypothetical protein
MPPRHTKSEFASYLFPAWYIGKYPKKKIMQVSHNAELSARFGSKVRNLIDSQEYKSIFGDVRLREDSKAKGRWETNHGGEYFAAGVGGSITGRGADLLIIDEIHIRNKIPCLIKQWIVLTIGIVQDQDNVYNQAEIFC